MNLRNEPQFHRASTYYIGPQADSRSHPPFPVQPSPRIPTNPLFQPFATLLPYIAFFHFLPVATSWDIWPQNFWDFLDNGITNDAWKRGFRGTFNTKCVFYFFFFFFVFSLIENDRLRVLIKRGSISLIWSIKSQSIKHEIQRTIQFHGEKSERFIIETEPSWKR